MDGYGIQKREKLTMEEHKKLAKELHSMNTRLTDLYEELYNRGYRNIPNKFYKASKQLSIIRSIMENSLFYEHPEEANIDIYYPGGGSIVI